MRMSAGQTFILTLRMYTEHGRHTLSFKQDGQRFAHQTTLKINADTKYMVELEFTPDQNMQSAEIQASQLEIVEKKQSDDGKEHFYLCKWDTAGLVVSEKGKRQLLLLLIKFASTERYLQIPIQSKIYKCGEKSHSQWGSACRWVKYDCKVENDDAIQILNERYFC